MANDPNTQPGSTDQNTSAGGSPPPGGTPAPSPRNETGVAGVAHLSSFFGPLLVPLIIWLAVRDSMPYAARQAKQAFFFHLLLVGLGVVVANVLVFEYVHTIFTAVSQSITSNIVTTPTVPPWLFALLAFVLVLVLTGQALCVYGAVQAFQGKDFSYPLLGWMK